MKEVYKLEKGMIDSHFHLLHINKKGLDGLGMLKESFRRGLTSGMEIGIVPENFDTRKEIIESFPNLYMASGLYPSHCEKENWKVDLPLLEAHLRSSDRIVALGEIGLDYFHDYGTKALQQELLLSQLGIANKVSLPVVIHCRNAEEDLLACLKQIPPVKGGIMHCFSSDPEWVTPFVDLGFYISFAGNVTYKNAGNLREAAKIVPDNRILTETDSPYLSPVPVRGKTNHPGYIGYTYQVLAEERGVELRELIDQIQGNFTRFTLLKPVYK
ncbi:MAG: TatD family hydrolase [Spirochaetales bacterium]|nr:TatD family hydrolase [Spirochaetales bacterium]